MFVFGLLRDHPQGGGPLAVGRQDLGHVRGGRPLFAVFDLKDKQGLIENLWLRWKTNGQEVMGSNLHCGDHL